MFILKSKFSPTGDQPQAIEKLSDGISAGLKNQVLLGVTGSGKTFTIANVIQKLQMPTLVISHNKTLAGQLYQEFRDFFPDNAVSYFVSYYDYYQPEAYIPSSDTYIEKEAQINDQIDKLRLQSTANILTRNDAIVVASVSCIYNIGDPSSWENMMLPIKVGDSANWNELSRKLVDLQYMRSEFEFRRGTFRVRGTYIDIYPAYEDYCYRLESEVGKINKISKIDPMTGKQIFNTLDSSAFSTQHSELISSIIISPAKHNITSLPAFAQAESQIRHDLAVESAALKKAGKELEAHRLTQKVNYDLEIIKEVGYVNGIENYSRYFDGRKPGDPPYSLLDYFRKAYGDNFIVCIDESHMTVPQIRGMYNGDHSRKQTLIDFGFRLRSAFDNRPSTFDEFYPKAPHIVYVSATPNEWELDLSKTSTKYIVQSTESENMQLGTWDLALGTLSGVVEQLIRPTGIVDPQITIRPAAGEIPDIIMEIEKRAAIHERVLVTTLTKKTAEDLTEYVKEKGVKAAYLHSDIHTLERSDVLDNLRNNTFDVLIGVNLLREGLDLPEVTLVAILDADKEGFLRSRTSLIQTMGRAARNVRGEVIMYADVITKSMKAAISEIDRRRTYQEQYNKEHGITPETIQKAIRERIVEKTENPADLIDAHHKRDTAFNYEFLQGIKPDSLTPYDRAKLLKKLEREMKRRAEMMDFEAAIAIRDNIKLLKK
jgi:excinuclease ABC subunit B